MAAQAHVNPQTLRYYERRGLLPVPERTASGYRAYSVDAVRLVRFVKRAQQLGFTLNDIEELLHLAGGGPASCEAAKTMARTRIADLEQRIEELVDMRDALSRLVDTCDRPRDERDCPILQRHRNRCGRTGFREELTRDASRVTQRARVPQRSRR